ncbi:MAG TPA: helix-turn-helix transcriptional regulator, partial [Ktedonobacteraceae bacterium]|nr:helix-turn-helix transcriptional regulator [Ktedonobacteraceae bacterium]
MNEYGVFLCSLRSNTGLSLEALAKMVASSKSTLSRLENGEIPRPFRGPTRGLVIQLAHLLCASTQETERYLSLAGIDRSLLTELEEIQLGFPPHVVKGSSEEKQDLERLERIYQQLLGKLETWEQELGVEDAPPTLKSKVQRYRNTLLEIQKRLDRLYNRSDPLDVPALEAMPAYNVETVEDRIVIGNGYASASDAESLYTLASDHARWLMQLAGVERFAVDDCIILANSEHFKGWEPDEVRTTMLTHPLPIPDDLASVQQEKIAAIEKHYFNTPHYRLVSATPAHLPFSEPDHLKIVLAPVHFFDYFSFNSYFDEPLLTTVDGSKISIRQKYGNTALTYSSTDKGTSLIPAPISIQCVVITEDQRIMLVQRSLSVAFYPNHWSASFEGTMKAPGLVKGQQIQKGDTDFFAGALRGLDEEFAISEDAVEDMKALSLNVEYLTLSVDVFMLIKLALTIDEIKQGWLLTARHRDEASRINSISTDLSEVVDRLFSRTLWHPT